MSNIIHMQTEIVEQTAQDMIYGATNLYDKVDELSHSKSRMAVNWTGGRSGEIQASLNQVITNLNNSIRALDTLGYSVQREIQQWMDADNPQSFISEYITNDPWGLAKDVGRFIVGGGIIAGLGTSLGRPNSITITVPGIFKAIFGGARNAKEFVGINPGVTVIRPENLPSQLNGGTIAVKSAVIDAAVTSGKQVYSDYGTYGLSTRFASAALVDTVVKGGAAFLLALAVGTAVTAVAGISAPLIVVAGATISTWLFLSTLSSHAQSAGWHWFESSGARQQAVEGVNREINQGVNAVQAAAQDLSDRIDQAFQPYINQLVPSS